MQYDCTTLSSCCIDAAVHTCLRLFSGILCIVQTKLLQLKTITTKLLGGTGAAAGAAVAVGVAAVLAWCCIRKRSRQQGALLPSGALSKQSVGPQPFSMMLLTDS